MKVDMSATAVTMRLKRVSQLRRLCLALGKATIVSTVIKGFCPPNVLTADELSAGGAQARLLPIPSNSMGLDPCC